ncbi:MULTISPECIES: hypothetical protein [unclassified Halomonas]|uniref:hypothetical protein n=1 Tax=unclassified Halomonas TaxID=2609666 RepID=UPI0005594104|nr:MULTISPECIES: hypothetical protein [unclassified Halomonas]CEP34821.1 Putative uncharacterized protein orf83 [Halomonas sp. R57-5]
MEEEYPNEDSRHCQEFTLDGHTIDVRTYRGIEPPTGCFREVVDESGTSTIWDDQLASDDKAMAEPNSTLEQEGIGPLVDTLNK